MRRARALGTALIAICAALSSATPASAYDDRTPPNIPDHPSAPAKDEGGGVFGPLRIGALAGAGASTHPVDLEAFVKIFKVAGVGFEYAFAPQIRLGGLD